MDTRRVCALLAWLAAGGLAVGAAVPVVKIGGLGAAESLVVLLVGALAAALAVGLVAVTVRRDDWSHLATGAIVTGVAVAGLAVGELVVVGSTAAGGRVWLLVPAGWALVVAGVVAATADLDPVLGRPLAGLGWHRGLVGAVAAAALVAGLSGFALAIATGALDFGSNWMPLAGTVLVAAAAALSASAAWSRPVAALWLPVAVGCVAGASATGPGAVLGLGGAVATLCCVAELGGASSTGSEAGQDGPAPAGGG
ncbi:MAG: hypothetical protein ABEJ42_01245 [Halobacteriaceae archaeon]